MIYTCHVGTCHRKVKEMWWSHVREGHAQVDYVQLPIIIIINTKKQQVEY
jgi:hypothetical protein